MSGCALLALAGCASAPAPTPADQGPVVYDTDAILGAVVDFQDPSGEPVVLPTVLPEAPQVAVIDPHQLPAEPIVEAPVPVPVPLPAPTVTAEVAAPEPAPEPMPEPAPAPLPVAVAVPMPAPTVSAEAVVEVVESTPAPAPMPMFSEAEIAGLVAGEPLSTEPVGEPPVALPAPRFPPEAAGKRAPKRTPAKPKAKATPAPSPAPVVEAVAAAPAAAAAAAGVVAAVAAVVPEPAPAVAPEPEPVAEPMPEPAPAPLPEPVPVPMPTPTVVAEVAPPPVQQFIEPAPVDYAGTQAFQPLSTEPVAADTPLAVAAPMPSPAPAPVAAPAPAAKASFEQPVAKAAPAPQPKPEPVPEPMPTPVTPVVEAVAAAPAAATAAVGVVAGAAAAVAAVVPEPEPEPEPEPMPEPEPEPAPVAVATPAPAPVPRYEEPPVSITDEALAYLDTAFNLVQQNALYRDRIDWLSARARMLEAAKHAQAPSDTYDALRALLADLKEDLAFFAPPSAAPAEAGGDLPNASQLGLKTDFFDGIATLTVPPVTGNEARVSRYATLLSESIYQLDQKDACGWIVDLRQLDGGEMQPPLVGLGPLLGEGVTGYFAYPDGRQTPYGYWRGEARGMAGTRARSYRTVRLRHQSPPIAVLIGQRTTQAGEATALAFHRRPNTVLVGEPTAGRAIAARSFPLSDGATLTITMARLADRLGRLQVGPLNPDLVVGRDRVRGPVVNGDVGAALARNWLRENGCRP